MDYIETVVNYAKQKTSHGEPMPVDIAGHALNMRTSPMVGEIFDSQSDRLNLSDLSEEQRYLARTRIAGSIATRFAMASFATPDVASFADLNESTQTDVMNELLSDYVTDAPSESPSLFINNDADPIAAVSHKDARDIVYRSRSATISAADRHEMMRYYATLTPGSFPQFPHTIAPIAENDATFTQAFGRDDITDKSLILIKKEREHFDDDTGMIEFLNSINFRPGPSNDALAKEVDAILTGPHPNEQMIQWEVACSLWKNHQDTYLRFKDYLHILWPSRGFYPTYEVKTDSIKAMDRVGAYNPAESAHSDMMIRALGIINKQGVIADPIEVTVPFDPGSTQPHVRNARSWVRREFLTRAEHIIRGRVKF